MGGTGGLQGLRPGDPREISGYPVHARIGEGGMGTVYLSRTRGNRPVALKVIRREYAEDPQYRLRFAQEARAARKVAGYHLVPVVDFDTDAEQPWIATAYQPGPALSAVLDAYGPLPMAAALQMTGCVARALHAVHTAGYVHRDVKPSNVLLGAEGPWLIDFGIARSVGSTRLTTAGGLVGTLRYMSPEHARGTRPGPPSDVFSLGLLAAVAATGRHPYGDAGDVAVAALIAGTDSHPPALDDCPAPLRHILRAALAAEPEERPDAAALAALCEEAAGRSLADLDGWLPGPVAAVVADMEEAVTAATRSAADPDPDPGPGPSSATPPMPGAVPAAAPAAGFGPPPHMPTVLVRPRPSPRPSLPGRGRRRVLTAGVGALAAVAVGVTATVVWQGRNDGTGTGTGTGVVSPEPSTSGGVGGERQVPYAPEGYQLLFANKPFTFAPPSRDDQANHLDLDVPRATYMERGALPGPAELVYNSDGWLGSILVVVGERKTVCTEEQQTAVLSHPLPAAELRLGRQVKVGTILCAITSNDSVAEAEITGIVPGEGSTGLPTFKGYVSAWKRPPVDN
ncbi:serine/threonine-protein kinase [Streptomyces sp. AC512_CC834]|uniref:serine/threonine-protein kinase n=1 Tax=Streptomyces sp. AC512_CC834 TaxID=2823691 RepID=UPI001C267883|nr:serine/threonine-protein kinase [Streptomyces sp. AC512_CC834]